MTYTGSGDPEFTAPAEPEPFNVAYAPTDSTDSSESSAAVIALPQRRKRARWILGVIALVLAVVAVILVVVGITLALGDQFFASRIVGYSAIAISIVGFLVGGAALILRRGRLWGVLAMVICVLANPVILTGLLNAAGTLVL